MRRVAVWAVYGTVGAKVGQRIAEYPFPIRAEAEKHANAVPNGYVVMEKVQR